MSHSLDPLHTTPTVDLPLSSLHLLENHILVEMPERKKQTAGGIVLPESAQRVHQLCNIVKYGKFHNDTIESYGLPKGFGASGDYAVILSDHEIEDPDFTMKNGRAYRVVGLEQLHSVWKVKR